MNWRELEPVVQVQVGGATSRPARPAQHRHGGITHCNTRGNVTMHLEYFL